MNVNPKFVRSAGAAAATAVAATLVLSACGSDGGSGDAGSVTGEGSTAQQKAMEHFADVLTDDDSVLLDYTGSGSGDGIKKFIAGDVDFAGSDSPLKDDEIAKAAERCGGNEAWHIPLVAGPVAIAYNLPGVDNLVLDPPTLAKIFNNKITKWNDPAIAALNKGADLPDTDIEYVYRSDSSGTTDNFTKFLKASAPADWPHEPAKEWQAEGGSGAAKSTGVGDTVSKTEGSIAYVEWGFATENNLGVASIDFGSGATELTAETAGKALDTVAFTDPGSKNLVVDSDALFKMNEPGAYPLLLTTYEIVCSTGYDDESVSESLKKAFSTILDKGQDGLAEAGYVPLPAKFTETLRGTIDAL